MSLHYLLDAHNIMHQMPSLADKELDAQRRGLISFVENKLPQGKNAITIVFDGRAGRSGVPASSIAQIIFSLDITADDRIKHIVEDANNAKNIRVVTNDRAVQYAVRALGARVIKVSEFLAAAKSLRSDTKREAQKISQQEEQQINSELESVWLKKKKS